MGGGGFKAENKGHPIDHVAISFEKLKLFHVEKIPKFPLLFLHS